MNAPVPDASDDLLLTAAQMAAVDAAAVARGVSMHALMEAAGRAVALAALRMTPASARIAVLCGPGNNGGDGYAAARLLAEAGCRPTVFMAARPAAGTAAAEAAARWQGPALDIAGFDPAGFALVIDGLYGAGLSRPIEGAEAGAIARIAAAGLPSLAIDVPSGLDADTGLAIGPVLPARACVTFFRRKPGHLLWPGRQLCGTVEVADIGIADADLAAVSAARQHRNTPALWRGHVRAADPSAHKYQRGHVLVASGGEFATGAARLSATAALNAGAGAVTLCGDGAALRVHAAHVTAIMLREAASPDEFGALLATGRYSACVIGPGVGASAATGDRLRQLARSHVSAVVDADAISVLGREAAPFPLAPADADWLLTPHEGEFERLFGARLMEDQRFAALPARLAASKLERARAAARLSGCFVVLKGIDTVIAAPDGRAAINCNAGPELATAGSGDVLAGLMAAHLAREMPAYEAACSAVWLHGLLGSRHGAGLTADRLVAIARPLDPSMWE